MLVRARLDRSLETSPEVPFGTDGESVLVLVGGLPAAAAVRREYAGTDLADAGNVTSLVELCRQLGIKFYFGGGWYTWHHTQTASGSIDRGIQYYQDMLALLPGAEGIYLEAAGEGMEVDERARRERTEGLRQLATSIWRDRPDFEFALCIGRDNSQDYRQAVHEIDQKRIFWFWCWGSAARPVLAEHPSRSSLAYAESQAERLAWFDRSAEAE